MVQDVAGTDLEMVQQTNYPWDGKVRITVNPREAGHFAVRLRLPYRSVSEIYDSEPAADGLESVRVNGETFLPHSQGLYAVIERDWKAGDVIEIQMRMPIQKVRAIEQVEATRGRVALRYGPLVYNIESVDQDVEKPLARDAELRAEWAPDLLGGVMVIRGQFADGSPLLAIPNYARNNRGGRSIVWIREE